MATRKIVKINEEKCNGCGLCIPNCAEGAIQIVNGKARLINDKFCDGLGACLGQCPEDAIQVIQREAEDFDEKAVEAHLHRKQNLVPETKRQPVFRGCPSSQPRQFKAPESTTAAGPSAPSVSMLAHWPVQLKLVPVNAPYFDNADLLVTADCVPFAYAAFHSDFMRGKAVVVGCPKLDDVQHYLEKLTGIFKNNSIKSVTLPYMEVPCCFGLVRATEQAIAASGKKIPLRKVKIGIQGDIKPEEEVRSLPSACPAGHGH